MPRRAARRLAALLPVAIPLLGCRPDPTPPAPVAEPSGAPAPLASTTSSAGPAAPTATAIVHEPGTVPAPPSARAAASAAPSAPLDPPQFSRLAAPSKSRKAAGSPITIGFTERGGLVRVGHPKGIDFIDPQKGTGFSITIGAEVSLIAMSSDGSRLALADGAERITLWDTGAGKLLHTWKVAATDMILSADGSKLAAATATKLLAWDAASFAEVFAIEPEAPVFGLAFTAGAKEIVATSNNVSVLAYDLATRKQLGGGGAETGGTFGIALSPDGRWAAASAPAGHGMQVFDVRSWGPRQLVVIEDCKEHVFPRFASNGRFVFAHGGSRWVKGFEAGSWKPYASYHAPPDREVASAADDLSRVVVTGEGKPPAVVVVESKAETRLERPFGGGEASYSISGDGQFVAAASGGEARIWAAKTGRIVYEVTP